MRPEDFSPGNFVERIGIADRCGASMRPEDFSPGNGRNARNGYARSETLQ